MCLIVYGLVKIRKQRNDYSRFQEIEKERFISIFSYKASIEKGIQYSEIWDFLKASFSNHYARKINDSS